MPVLPLCRCPEQFRAVSSVDPQGLLPRAAVGSRLHGYFKCCIEAMTMTGCVCGPPFARGSSGEGSAKAMWSANSVCLARTATGKSPFDYQTGRPTKVELQVERGSWRTSTASGSPSVRSTRRPWTAAMPCPGTWICAMPHRDNFAPNQDCAPKRCVLCGLE